MEPEDILLCSGHCSTGPNPEPDQFNPYHPILYKIHFNIVHPPTSWSSQWSLSLWLTHHILYAQLAASQEGLSSMSEIPFLLFRELILFW
jgi:hypothetical protein